MFRTVVVRLILPLTDESMLSAWQTRSRPVTLPDEALDALIRVLDAIRHSEGLSRTEVAHRTGLSRAVVAQRVGELSSAASSPMGPWPEPRRASPATPRPQRRCRSPPRGRSRRDERQYRPDRPGRHDPRASTEPSDIGDGPEAILSLVETRLTSSSALIRDSLWASASAGASRVPDGLTGLAADHAGLGRPCHPRTLRARVTAPPCGWDNDVNVMALGEWRSGVAAGHANVTFVSIGTGIGAGLTSTASSTAARRARRATSATSRSWTIHRSFAWCGHRLPRGRRGGARPDRDRDGRS